MTIIKITNINIIIKKNTYFIIITNKTNTYQINTINNYKKLYKHQQKIYQTNFIK